MNSMRMGLIAVRVSNEICRIRLSAKIDDLITEYPDLSDSLKKIKSKNLKPKYFDWSIKQLLEGDKVEDLLPTIEYFDRNQNRFKEKDINKYEKLKDLEDLVKEISQTKSKKQERKETKTSGSTKLYEDDTNVLIRIENKKACVEYGKGTQWCISMEDADYFEGYSAENTIFYFWINKKLDQMDPLAKVAIAVMRDQEFAIEVYDAEDTLIDENDAPGLPEIMNKILSDAKSFKTKTDKINENPMDFMKDEDGNNRFEVAKIIDLKHLPEMMKDEDGYVRIIVARRIDSKYLPEMMKDEDSNVRKEVARRIDPKYYPEMMKDDSHHVRAEVARRIDPKYLDEMMKDKYYGVRIEALRRVDPKYWVKMMKDDNEFVRSEIVRRIDSKYYSEMMKDESHHVRLEVATRIDSKYLPEMMKDESEFVRMEIASRIDPIYLPEMMNDKYKGVRIIVARRIDPKYLDDMMKDESEEVVAEASSRINQGGSQE